MKAGFVAAASAAALASALPESDFLLPVPIPGLTGAPGFARPDAVLKHNAGVPAAAEHAALEIAQLWRNHFVEVVYTPEGRRRHGHDWREYLRARQEEEELLERALSGEGGNWIQYVNREDWERFAEARAVETETFTRLHTEEANAEAVAEFEAARRAAGIRWDGIRRQLADVIEGAGAGDTAFDWRFYEQARLNEVASWNNLHQRYGYDHYHRWNEFNPFLAAARETTSMWQTLPPY